MNEDLDYKRAPQANLATYKGVNKLIMISSIGIAVFLLILAATLV